MSSADPAHDEPTLRERLLDFHTLEPRLRLLTGVVLAEIIVAALLLLLRDVDLEMIDIEPMAVPAIHYWLTAVLVAGGLALLCYGLTQASWRGALAFSGILAAVYVLAILAAYSEPWDNVLLLGTVYMIAVLSVGVPVSYMRSYSPERRQMPVVWTLVFIMSGSIAAGVLSQPHAFNALLMLIRAPLVYVFLVAGVDWAEMTDMASRWGVRRSGLEARSGLLSGTVAVVGGAFLVYLYMTFGDSVFDRLPVFVAAAVWLVALLWLVRIPAGISSELPWAPTVLVAVGFLLYGDLITIKHAELTLLLPISFGLLMSAGLWYITRRPPYHWLFPSVLFGLILSLWYLVGMWPVDASPVGEVEVPAASLFFLMTAAVLLGVCGLAVRAASGADVRPVLRGVLVFQVGMIGLHVLWSIVYQQALEVGEEILLLGALLVLVALLWEILVSGHAITNVDSKLFPRRSRVLIFFAYVTLAVATMVFWGSMRGEGDIALIVSIVANPDYLVQVGIATLGPSVLAVMLILRTTLARQAASAPPAPVSPDSHRA